MAAQLRSRSSLSSCYVSCPTGCRAGGLSYRQTDVDVHLPVFWREGSRRLPTSQEPGRWNKGGRDYAQYLSLSEDAAWAEFIRAAHIDLPAVAAGKRRHMWVCQVHDHGIADLRTPNQLQACGIEPAVVVGPYEPCQEIAGQLVSAGYRGVLTPCAALEGALSLTLFGPRGEHHLPPGEDFDSRYIDADVVDVKLRKSAGSPPEDLLGQTRSLEADPGTYGQWPSTDAGRPSHSPELEAALELQRQS